MGGVRGGNLSVVTYIGDSARGTLFSDPGISLNRVIRWEACMNLKIRNILNGLDRCPHCNVANPLLSQEWTSIIATPDRRGSRGYATYQCSKCCRVVMVESRQTMGTPQSGYSQGQLPDHIENIYPNPTVIDSNLPEEAQRYLKQAVNTVFAPDASVVMSASAVDAMLKAKNYKDGSLYTRIARAIEDHVLTEDMGKWAHKVRLDANAVRHADEEIAPPKETDARMVLEFASALGDFLFVFTARVEEGIKEAIDDAATS